MIQKQPLSFPLWVEALLVVILLFMACIESAHDQWFWAAIFGISGSVFAISVIARLRSGDKNGQT